jgi:hypothetical protein
VVRRLILLGRRGRAVAADPPADLVHAGGQGLRHAGGRAPGLGLHLRGAQALAEGGGGVVGGFQR